MLVVHAFGTIGDRYDRELMQTVGRIEETEMAPIPRIGKVTRAALVMAPSEATGESWHRERLASKDSWCTEVIASGEAVCVKPVVSDETRDTELIATGGI